MNCIKFFSDPYLSCISEQPSFYPFVEMPPEIQSNIASYLELNDLDILSLVCKTFDQIINTDKENSVYLNEERKLRAVFRLINSNRITKQGEKEEATKEKEKLELQTCLLMDKIKDLSSQLESIRFSYYYRFIPFAKLPDEKIKELESEIKKSEDLNKELNEDINILSKTIANINNNISKELLSFRQTYRDFKKNSSAEQLVYELVGGRKAFNKLPVLVTTQSVNSLRSEHVTASLMRIMKDNKPYALTLKQNEEFQVLYKKYADGTWSPVGCGILKSSSHLIYMGVLKDSCKETYEDLQVKIEDIKKTMTDIFPPAKSSLTIEEFA